ncbi:MAG: hypothetical protein ACI9N0_001963, partial [Ilumatobacter sp.]
VGGKACIYSLAAIDLVADVSGFFPAGSDFTPITNPTRILDTRPAPFVCNRGAAYVKSTVVIKGFQYAHDSIHWVDTDTGEMGELVTLRDDLTNRAGSVELNVARIEVGTDCHLYIVGERNRWEGANDVTVDRGVYRVPLFGSRVTAGQVQLWAPRNFEASGYSADGTVRYELDGPRGIPSGNLGSYVFQTGYGRVVRACPPASTRCIIEIQRPPAFTPELYAADLRSGVLTPLPPAVSFVSHAIGPYGVEVGINYSPSGTSTPAVLDMRDLTLTTLPKNALNIKRTSELEEFERIDLYTLRSTNGRVLTLEPTVVSTQGATVTGIPILLLSVYDER